MINPHYDHEKAGFTEQLVYEDPNSSYDYATSIFCKTADGKLFFAEDSGCSCPTPFEDGFSAETPEAVQAKMRRIHSRDEAHAILAQSWDHCRTHDSRQKLADFLAGLEINAN